MYVGLKTTKTYCIDLCSFKYIALIYVGDKFTYTCIGIS